MSEFTFGQSAIFLILGIAVVANIAVRVLAHYGYTRAAKIVRDLAPLVIAAVSSPTKEQALSRLLEAVNALPTDDPRALRARLEAEALAELAKPRKTPSSPPAAPLLAIVLAVALSASTGCITSESMRTTIADVEDLRRKGDLVIVAAQAACDVQPMDPDLVEPCDVIDDFERIADAVYVQWKRIVCLVAPEQCI